MFRKGRTAQQKSLFDPERSFSSVMEKLLKKSWAGKFFETILLAIHEERFSILYSETASLPNCAINLLVSLLLL